MLEKMQGTLFLFFYCIRRKPFILVLCLNPDSLLRTVFTSPFSMWTNMPAEHHSTSPRTQLLARDRDQLGEEVCK